MLELTVPIPSDLKEIVIEKLKYNNIVNRLEKKIQMGIIIAIDEIENPSEKSILSSKKHLLYKNEINSLNKIFKFLEKNELNFTLNCLKEECESLISNKKK